MNPRSLRFHRHAAADPFFKPFGSICRSQLLLRTSYSTWCDPSFVVDPVRSHRSSSLATRIDTVDTDCFISIGTQPILPLAHSRRSRQVLLLFLPTISIVDTRQIISNKCWMIKETCLFDETVQFIRNCKQCGAASYCCCRSF